VLLRPRAQKRERVVRGNRCYIRVNMFDSVSHDSLMHRVVLPAPTLLNAEVAPLIVGQ
jgi:hypothetical protein